MFCPSRYVLASHITDCPTTAGLASCPAKQLVSSAERSETVGDGLAVSESGGTAGTNVYIPFGTSASHHGVTCNQFPAVPTAIVQQHRQGRSNRPIQPSAQINAQHTHAYAIKPSYGSNAISGHAQAVADPAVPTTPASQPNTLPVSDVLPQQIAADDTTHSQLYLPSAVQQLTRTTAAAPAETQQQHPVDYWEDQYQLPFAALRSHWPDQGLINLLSQQANCLFDFSLPTELPPTAAAALETVAAASSVMTSSGGTVGDVVAGDKTVLMPLTVQQSVQQYISSTAASSSSSTLSGAQLLQYIRAAAANTVAAVSAVQCTADGTTAQQQPAVTATRTSQSLPAASAAAAQQSRRIKQWQQQQQQVDKTGSAVAAADVDFGEHQLNGSYLLRLACPHLMVGYQSDVLEVPASYLPLWCQLGFNAVSPAKTVIYTTLAPSSSTAITAAFCKDLAAMYSCCRLGCMRPWQQTDGPPAPPTPAAATGHRSTAAAGGVVLGDAAVVPINTAASSSGGYGTSSAAAADTVARTSITSDSSCWLRNLASAARSLQAQLLLKPPELLFPPPWVVTSPDLTQLQEASFVIFVVIPDNDMTVITQEGKWNSSAVGSQQQQQQLSCNTALAVRSFETVARYMAPIATAAAAGRAASTGNATIEPHQQQQQPPYDIGVGIDVVIQLVSESVVRCPSDAQLRGVAMTLYHKVRRRHNNSTAAAADHTTTMLAGDQQQSSQQVLSQHDVTAAAVDAAAVDASPGQPGSQDHLSAAVVAAADPLPHIQDQVVAPWVTTAPLATCDAADTTPAAAAAADQSGVLMYEPLIILAPSQQHPAQSPPPPAAAVGTSHPQQGKDEAHESVGAVAGGEQQQQQQQGRTLHCCYYWLDHKVAAQQQQQQQQQQEHYSQRISWLAITWTDSNTELLESKLIRIPGQLLPAVASKWVCAVVLAECLTFAADISSSVSCDQDLFTRSVIARLGNQMSVGEEDTWRGLLSAMTGGDDAARALEEMLLQDVVCNEQQQQQRLPEHSHCAADGCDIWGDLKQHLAAALAAVRDQEAVAAVTTPQQRHVTRRGNDMLLRHISVVTVTPDGPLYVGSSHGRDHPQGVLLLQPGAHHHHHQHIGPAAHADASIVWMAAATAADSLLPGEVDAARLLHVSLLATAVIPQGAWAAAAAATTAWCNSRGKQAAGVSWNIAQGAIQDGAATAPAAAAASTEVMQPLDAAAAVAADEALDAAPQQQQQQHHSDGDVSGGCGILDMMSHSSDVVEFTPEPVVIHSPSETLEVNNDDGDLSWDRRDADHDGNAVRDHSTAAPRAVNMVYDQHQQKASVHANVTAVAAATKRRRIDKTSLQQQQQGGSVLAGSSKQKSFSTPAAALAAVSAELSALSVVGVGLHGLFGYDACDALRSRQKHESASSASGLHPSPGSALHLPLHAAAAWRLWVLAAAMDEVAT